jgi:hypothetical protein
MRHIRPAAVVLLPWLAVLSGCADPAAEKAKAVAVARSAVEASAEQAAAAAATPVTTGRWDEAHLVERLVRAGLAPQAIPGDQGTRNFRVPGIVFQLGTSRLTVYLYPDSVARLAVTAGLDTTALGPTPVQGEPPVLRQLIVQNNLAAVLIGGSERQQERVMLALSAGLPVQP